MGNGSSNCQPVIQKVNNKHLHQLLKSELFLKLDDSLSKGTVVQFELQDIMQGTEKIVTVTYNYLVEEYDNYAVKLVLKEIL